MCLKQKQISINSTAKRPIKLKLHVSVPVKGSTQPRKGAATNTGHDVSVNGSICDNILLPLLNTVSYNIIIILAKALPFERPLHSVF